MKKTSFIVIFLVIILLSIWKNNKEIGTQNDKIMMIPFEYITKNSIDENIVIKHENFNKTFDFEKIIYTDVSYIYHNSANKIVNLYLVYESHYDLLYVEVNPNSKSEITVNVKDDIKEIYYTFTEFESVSAITVSSSTKVLNLGVFSNSNSSKTEIVGGNPQKRVFQQLDFAALHDKIYFSIYNAFYANEIQNSTEKFGEYIFVITKE